MKAFRYRIVAEWSEEDGAFVARVPAFPGCAAHGPTEADAVREARRAAEAMLTVLRKDGDAAPPEDATGDYSGQLRLRIPRSLHKSLSQQADVEGVSLNTLMLSRLAATPRAEEPDSSRESPEESGPSTKAQRARSTSARKAATTSSAESLLRALGAEIGLGRAVEILGEHRGPGRKKTA